MKRKILFKNWATELRIRKLSSCAFQIEEVRPRGQGNLLAVDRVFKTYENARNALQRYSRRYYGEEAT